MFKNFIQEISIWGNSDETIDSIILIGSYARGTNKHSSDVDICIITANKTKMLKKNDFINLFGDVKKSVIEYWGACTSIRVWYKNGMEVEFGLVEPSWIQTPLDDGTRKVLTDGYKVIIDKKNNFGNLVL